MPRIPNGERPSRAHLPRTGARRAALAVGCVLALAVGSTAAAWTHETTGTFEPVVSPTEIPLLQIRDQTNAWIDSTTTSLEAPGEFAMHPEEGAAWRNGYMNRFYAATRLLDSRTGEPLTGEVTVTLVRPADAHQELHRSLLYQLYDFSGTFTPSDPWRTLEEFNALPAEERTMPTGDGGAASVLQIRAMSDDPASYEPDEPTRWAAIGVRFDGGLTP